MVGMEIKVSCQEPHPSCVHSDTKGGCVVHGFVNGIKSKCQNGKMYHIFLLSFPPSEDHFAREKSMQQLKPQRLVAFLHPLMLDSG